MLKDAEHVVVDFGAPGSPRNASLYFDVVDGNMEVTIYATTTPRPSLSMAPTTAAPSQTPSAEAGACGKTKYCCDFIDVDGYQTFYKIRDVSGDAYCCTERCSYANAQNYYLHYISAGGQYYMTTSEPCYTSGALSYIATMTSDDVEASCDAGWWPSPTAKPAETVCTEDSESWYKDGSPDKGCAWVAEDLSRCDSKEDAAGVLANVGCMVTCTGCTPSDGAPAPTAAPVAGAAVPAPTASPVACVADSASWYKSGSPDKGCAWVADDTSRCTSKENDAGVLAEVDCVATCTGCTPDAAADPDPTPAPTPLPGDPTAAPVPAPTPAPEPRPTRRPTPRPTRRPTPRPSAARGDPTPRPVARTPSAPACEDDDDWLYDGKDGRGCAWIAEKTSRCDGKDGAREACPATCGECEPACEDDETWFSKKSSNNCRWVAEKPDSRCSKKSDDKVKAKDACPVACGTCV